MAAEFRLPMSVNDGRQEQEEETKRICRYPDNLLLTFCLVCGELLSCDGCSNAVLFKVKEKEI
jgi:hypothetical protein